MALEDASGLYLLHLCVDSVILIDETESRRKTVCVQVFFWGLPCINIYQAQPETTDQNVFRNFEIGSSGYFYSETIELIKSIQRHQILVTVFEALEGSEDRLDAVGTAKIKVTEKFSEVIRKAATTDTQHPVSGVVKGTYNLTNKENIIVGSVRILIKLYCYDNSLLKAQFVSRPDEHGLESSDTKYLLPRKTSDGIILIPADPPRKTSNDCEFMEKRPMKGGSLMPIDIASLLCDANVSEKTFRTGQSIDSSSRRQVQGGNENYSVAQKRRASYDEERRTSHDDALRSSITNIEEIVDSASRKTTIVGIESDGAPAETRRTGGKALTSSASWIQSSQQNLTPVRIYDKNYSGCVSRQSTVGNNRCYESSAYQNITALLPSNLPGLPQSFARQQTGMQSGLPLSATTQSVLPQSDEHPSDLPGALPPSDRPPSAAPSYAEPSSSRTWYREDSQGDDDSRVETQSKGEVCPKRAAKDCDPLHYEYSELSRRVCERYLNKKYDEKSAPSYSGMRNKTALDYDFDRTPSRHHSHELFSRDRETHSLLSVTETTRYQSPYQTQHAGESAGPSSEMARTRRSPRFEHDNTPTVRHIIPRKEENFVQDLTDQINSTKRYIQKTSPEEKNKHSQNVSSQINSCQSLLAKCAGTNCCESGATEEFLNQCTCADVRSEEHYQTERNDANKSSKNQNLSFSGLEHVGTHYNKKDRRDGKSPSPGHRNQSPRRSHLTGEPVGAQYHKSDRHDATYYQTRNRSNRRSLLGQDAKGIQYYPSEKNITYLPHQQSPSEDALNKQPQPDKKKQTGAISFSLVISKIAGKKSEFSQSYAVVVPGKDTTHQEESTKRPEITLSAPSNKPLKNKHGNENVGQRGSMINNSEYEKSSCVRHERSSFPRSEYSSSATHSMDTASLVCRCMGNVGEQSESQYSNECANFEGQTKYGDRKFCERPTQNKSPSKKRVDVHGEVSSASEKDGKNRRGGSTFNSEHRCLEREKLNDGFLRGQRTLNQENNFIISKSPCDQQLSPWNKPVKVPSKEEGIQVCVPNIAYAFTNKAATEKPTKIPVIIGESRMGHDTTVQGFNDTGGNIKQNITPHRLAQNAINKGPDGTDPHEALPGWMSEPVIDVESKHPDVYFNDDRPTTTPDYNSSRGAKIMLRRNILNPLGRSCIGTKPEDGLHRNCPLKNHKNFGFIFANACARLAQHAYQIGFMKTRAASHNAVNHVHHTHHHFHEYRGSLVSKNAEAWVNYSLGKDKRTEQCLNGQCIWLKCHTN